MTAGSTIQSMAPGELVYEEVTHSVIGAFFDVYNYLGYGFLERIYVSALDRELRACGHAVAREVLIPVFYKGEDPGTQRLDMIVDSLMVIETKAGGQLPAHSHRQLYNYLRAARLEVGLLLYFGPKPNVHRVRSGQHQR